MSNIKVEKISLHDIEQLKEEKLMELRRQKELINERTQLIFAPIEPATNKVESLIRTVNTGMAIFDGVMLGMKTIGKLKKAIGRKK